MTDLIRKSDADAAIVGCKGNGATRQYCRDAIAALPAVTVGVRKLVWGPHPSSLSTIEECAIADAPFSHRYQVQRDPWAHSYMAFLHPRLPITDSTLWWESKGHPTLDAAKAAAQADYTARILAALEPAALTPTAVDTSQTPDPAAYNRGYEDCLYQRGDAPNPAAIREATLLEARDAIADYPRVSPDGTEAQHYDEQIEHCQSIILALIAKGAAE